MKKSTLFIVLALFVSIGTFAQEKAPPPDVLYENVCIQSNRSMETRLETAIQAYNLKFHPEGPNHASLVRVNYGEKPAGMYGFSPQPPGKGSTSELTRETAMPMTGPKPLIPWLQHMEM